MNDRFMKNVIRTRVSDLETGTFDDQRISWEPHPVHSGETVHIHYNGLLKNSGASAIYLHYGFDRWNSTVNTVKMNREADGDFAADVPVRGSHELNFCFKDCANNWDNNNGHNWALPIH